MAAMERQGISACHECMRVLRQSRRLPQPRFATATSQWRGRSFITSAQSNQLRGQRGINHQPVSPQQVRCFTASLSLRRDASANLSRLHTRILELSNDALQPDNHRPPPEQRILYVIEQLDAVARSLVDARSVTAAKDISPATATSALLGSVNARSYPAFLSKASLLSLIGEKTEDIIRNKDVFITQSILKAYVELQSLLHRPNSFPDVFALYASKPTPKVVGDHIEYVDVNPAKASAAVQSATANAALTAGIAAHDLPLCADIIETSFGTPAFKKAKFLRKGLIPSTLLVAAPVVAYALSKQFAMIQQTMEPAHATALAFAGIMTYFSGLGMLGYIVVTTYNDHMERVTWAKGVPLWERWIREEERAALDRVAGHWGFKSVDRRGEEEGLEWESLREFIGLRGMVLDRVTLMPGMQ